MGLGLMRQLRGVGVWRLASGEILKMDSKDVQECDWSFGREGEGSEKILDGDRRVVLASCGDAGSLPLHSSNYKVSSSSPTYLRSAYFPVNFRMNVTCCGRTYKSYTNKICDACC
jgi:hypothetical protein